MTTVVVLLLANGALGAFDTLWYHEHRAGLARRPARHGTELRLHAGRDAVYAVVYGTVGWWQWRGAGAWVLGALLAVEVVVTLADFVVEDRTRVVAAGERILHSVMAIVYGTMLAFLVPELVGWAALPTALGPPAGAGPGAAGLTGTGVPTGLAVVASLLGAGIAASGARDALASTGRGPWTGRHPRPRGNPPEHAYRTVGTLVPRFTDR